MVSANSIENCCGALQGPFYVDAIMSFVDERCPIFDTEEENKFEYTAVSAT